MSLLSGKQLIKQDLSITWAHKLRMIHRLFLWMSWSFCCLFSVFPHPKRLSCTLFMGLHGVPAHLRGVCWRLQQTSERYAETLCRSTPRSFLVWEDAREAGEASRSMQRQTTARTELVGSSYYLILVKVSGYWPNHDVRCCVTVFWQGNSWSSKIYR